MVVRAEVASVWEHTGCGGLLRRAYCALLRRIFLVGDPDILTCTGAEVTIHAFVGLHPVSDTAESFSRALF